MKVITIFQYIHQDNLIHIDYRHHLLVSDCIAVSRKGRARTVAIKKRCRRPMLMFQPYCRKCWALLQRELSHWGHQSTWLQPIQGNWEKGSRAYRHRPQKTYFKSRSQGFKIRTETLETLVDYKLEHLIMKLEASVVQTLTIFVHALFHLITLSKRWS